MRSVFPAFQDRLLASLLWVALGLLIATILVATMGGGGDAQPHGTGLDEVPPQFVFGATPAQ